MHPGCVFRTSHRMRDRSRQGTGRSWCGRRGRNTVACNAPRCRVLRVTRALLLMDIQNTLVERFAAADEDAFLDRMVDTQQRAEQAGVLVVLVRAAFRPGYPEISSRNKAQGQFKA